MVRGKGGQRAQIGQMPLPTEVGRATAIYLKKGRPRCTSRRVFIRERAPRVGFANSAAVSTLVKRALADAGGGLHAHWRLRVQIHARHGDAQARSFSRPRSGNCCGPIQTRPKSTRRWMSVPCVRWHCAGREVGDEIPQTGDGGGDMRRSDTCQVNCYHRCEPKCSRRRLRNWSRFSLASRG